MMAQLTEKTMKYARSNLVKIIYKLEFIIETKKYINLLNICRKGGIELQLLASFSLSRDVFVNKKSNA